MLCTPERSLRHEFLETPLLPLRVRRGVHRRRNLRDRRRYAAQPKAARANGPLGTDDRGIQVDADAAGSGEPAAAAWGKA